LAKNLRLISQDTAFGARLVIRLEGANLVKQPRAFAVVKKFRRGGFRGCR
jgi:hypothetical protein